MRCVYHSFKEHIAGRFDFKLTENKDSSVRQFLNDFTRYADPQNTISEEFANPPNSTNATTWKENRSSMRFIFEKECLVCISGKTGNGARWWGRWFEMPLQCTGREACIRSSNTYAPLAFNSALCAFTGKKACYPTQGKSVIYLNFLYDL